MAKEKEDILPPPPKGKTLAEKEAELAARGNEPEVEAAPARPISKEEAALRTQIEAEMRAELQMDLESKDKFIREAQIRAEIKAKLFRERQEEEAKKPKVPVKVVATRPGFYGNRRIKEGDKFTIEHHTHMGEWMKKI